VLFNRSLKGELEGILLFGFIKGMLMEQPDNSLRKFSYMH